VVQEGSAGAARAPVGAAAVGNVMNGMRVRADRSVCVGAGNRVLTVSEVFDQDDAEDWYSSGRPTHRRS